MSGSAEMIFADRLREERQHAGLTQADLAERLSRRLGSTVDKSALARIERNERGIRLDEAVAIAEVLEIELAELLSRKGRQLARLKELRRELGRQKSRESEAEYERDQALTAQAVAQQEIEKLEAALGD